MSAPADWLYKRTESRMTTLSGSATVAALGDDEIVRGLKEMLAQGSRQAIAKLGKPAGFRNNLSVRIPMPEHLQKVERVLRSLKQDKLVDEFVATLNQAAEKAVPEAATILGDSLAKMTLENARGILARAGRCRHAATQYFRKTSADELRERFLPIVRQATEQTGVTAAYKRLIQRAGPYAQLMGSQAGRLCHGQGNGWPVQGKR